MTLFRMFCRSFFMSPRVRLCRRTREAYPPVTAQRDDTVCGVAATTATRKTIKRDLLTLLYIYYGLGWWCIHAVLTKLLVISTIFFTLTVFSCARKTTQETKTLCREEQTSHLTNGIAREFCIFFFMTRLGLAYVQIYMIPVMTA